MCRDIDKVAAHSRWPLTTVVAQGRYYCSLFFNCTTLHRPYSLFNLCTENIFGAMNTNKGIRIGGTTINNLRYADDTDHTVLLADTEEDLQEILNKVNRIGIRFDMKMNAKKTKTMLVAKDVALTKVSLKIDGHIIKQTDNYTYLGQTITSNGKCDDEILKIIEIARGSMLKTISARHISMKTRKIIIKACVWSTRL